MDNKQVVGMRLQRARIRKGLTQHQLGKAVGLTDHQIGRRERGEVELSYYDAERIAVVLDTSVQYFFYGSSTTGEIEAETLSWLLNLLLYYYKSPDVRASVIRLNKTSRCLIYLFFFCVISSWVMLFPKLPTWGLIGASLICPLFVLILFIWLIHLFREEEKIQKAFS